MQLEFIETTIVGNEAVEHLFLCGPITHHEIETGSGALSSAWFRASRISRAGFLDWFVGRQDSEQVFHAFTYRCGRDDDDDDSLAGAASVRRSLGH